MVVNDISMIYLLNHNDYAVANSEIIGLQIGRVVAKSKPNKFCITSFASSLSPNYFHLMLIESSEVLVWSKWMRLSFWGEARNLMQTQRSLY